MDLHFETFAKKICEYCMTSFILPWVKRHGVIQSYRAQVVSMDTNAKTATVQRPFDNAVTLPYANGAENLTAGEQCIVLSLGSESNSVVFADGKMNLSFSGGGGGGDAPDPYTSNPLMDGVASPGSSAKYARGDHVHPTDTSRAAVSDIPTNTSDLTNDSGFITASDVPKEIWYGTCSTAAATQIKVVNTTSGNLTLTTGAMVRVLFTSSQTYNGTAQLNVDGTGAVDVYRTSTDATSRYYWAAGAVVDFVYDGNHWVMVGKGYATTTYYGITKLSSSVSSTSTSLAASASAVKSVNDKIEERVPTPPTTAGTYTLQCVVDSGGNPTYSWGNALTVTQNANNELVIG